MGKYTLKSKPKVKSKLSPALRLRRTKRKTGRVIVPRYLLGPFYGSVGLKGGSSMKVLLGPAAALPWHYGSKTSILSIPQIMKPLHAEDPGKWVAGHLLNDNLGGSGTDSRNLTPLTATANKQHAGYEGKVKKFCTAAYLYHRNHRQASFWYGLMYTVTVSPLAFGGFAPYHRAPSHITLRTRVYKVDKENGTATRVNDLLDDFAWRYEFGPVEVHNRDSHLNLV